MTLRLLVLVMLTWAGIQVGEARLALAAAAANQHVVKAYGSPKQHGRNRSGSQLEWRSFLKRPKRAKKTKLPAKWSVYVPPEGFAPKGGSASGGIGIGPATPQDFVERSVLMLVGVCMGHDQGVFDPTSYKSAMRAGATVLQYPEGEYFPPGPARERLKLRAQRVAEDPGYFLDTATQYTTYYLRVDGYLLDRTGRRARFIKVIHEGGYLRKGWRGAGGMPFLKPGQRYLLFLMPTRGSPDGNLRAKDELMGQGDEYRITGILAGKWDVDEQGGIVGRTDLYATSEPPYRSTLTLQGWLPRLAKDVRQHKRFYDPQGVRLRERYQHLLRPWQPQ